MYLVLGLLAVLALFLAARRAITIVVLDCVGGRLRVVTGGIAPRVLADLQDVVARPPIPKLRIRISRDRGRAVLAFRGAIDANQEQRIRNVVGSLPLAKLVNHR